MDSEKVEPKHFIQHEVEKDLAAGKNDGRIMTRFPQSQMVIYILAIPKLFV